MNITIIHSNKSHKMPKTVFEMQTDTKFANNKFIPHLKDEKKVCNLCGKKCYWCRGEYNLDFSQNIKEIISLPDVYPLFVDNPLDYLPEKFKKSDVFIPLGIHEDILIEIPRLAYESGGKALIVPIEDSKWVSRWVKDKTIEECKKYSLEYAFPKPFCTLNKGKSKTINQFIEIFKIGKPRFKFYVNSNDIIEWAEVIISAPCGNGYNIAKHLTGSKLGEEAKMRVAKYWHSFPCMGSMEVDPELGDTILHIGGYTHYEALENAEIVRI
ncbi:DUF166 domain-containing protein [Thermohalobacter berrensis]|uniref:Thymidylate synthase n=1 Tax=Thermohalobacter berrensis TaxID=99594 RepID=A0A419T264_9FIRM|nr:DUF166 family protein [Thermohalobacter berrensis]RKD31650.1 hypothetical protein BET03_12170 [Thermohalobacter berrensis]